MVFGVFAANAGMKLRTLCHVAIIVPGPSVADF